MTFFSGSESHAPRMVYSSLALEPTSVTRTRVPMLTTLGGYWLFGIPLSLLFGFRTGLGAVGLWWGLAAALGLVAVILALRTWNLLHRPLERVVVDAERVMA